MRSVMQYGLWLIAAAGTLYLVLDPEIGLIGGGATTALGVGLLGGAIFVEAGRASTETPEG
jgi:hypothetical protein